MFGVASGITLKGSGGDRSPQPGSPGTQPFGALGHDPLLLVDSLLELVAVDVRRPDDALVDDSRAALADCTHRKLRLPWQPDLPDHDQVEWQPEGIGDFSSDGHAPARQPEHDGVLAAQVIEASHQ